MLTIEVFTAPNCNRCGKALDVVKEVVEELNSDDVEFHKRDVLENIDYAVQLGILATPAIALNGDLIFTSRPSKATLMITIEEYRKRGK